MSEQSTVPTSVGKAARKSRAVLANAFAIISVVALHLLGVEIPVEEIDAVTDGLSDVIVKVGLVASNLVAIYGRIAASQRIKSLF